jgi:hypothetical protein
MYGKCTSRSVHLLYMAERRSPEKTLTWALWSPACTPLLAEASILAACSPAVTGSILTPGTGNALNSSHSATHPQKTTGTSHPDAPCEPQRRSEADAGQRPVTSLPT